MTETMTSCETMTSREVASEQPAGEADACPALPDHPTDMLIELIVNLLAPMFRGVGADAGDLALARLAAIETLNGYDIRTQADLLSAAQIIGFGLAALASLTASMAGDVAPAMALRLRSNANALNRSAEQNRRVVAQRREGGRRAQRSDPGEAAMVTPGSGGEGMDAGRLAKRRPTMPGARPPRPDRRPPDVRLPDAARGSSAAILAGDARASDPRAVSSALSDAAAEAKDPAPSSAARSSVVGSCVRPGGFASDPNCAAVADPDTPASTVPRPADGSRAVDPGCAAPAVRPAARFAPACGAPVAGTNTPASIVPPPADVSRAVDPDCAEPAARPATRFAPACDAAVTATTTPASTVPPPADVSRTADPDCAALAARLATRFAPAPHAVASAGTEDGSEGSVLPEMPLLAAAGARHHPAPVRDLCG